MLNYFAAAQCAAFRRAIQRRVRPPYSHLGSGASSTLALSMRCGASSSRRVCSSSQAANFASLRMGRSTSPCTMRQISCAWNSASVYALHHVENWLLCRCRSSY